MSRHISCLCLLAAIIGSVFCRDEACLQPALIGKCRAAIPTVYYNSETGSCDCFLFGGCGANSNNFRTIEECMQTCDVSHGDQISSTECDNIFGPRPEIQPPVVGGGFSPEAVQQLQAIFSQFTPAQAARVEQVLQQQLVERQQYEQQQKLKAPSPQRPIVFSPSFQSQGNAIGSGPETASPAQASQPSGAGVGGNVRRLSSSFAFSSVGNLPGQLQIGQPVRITG